MKVIHTDCLVVGAGLAGCVYAHQAAKKGLHTLVLCCGEMARTNSDLAQGGIVYEPNLQLDDLLQDVRMATAGLCNERAVRELSVAGCKAVEEIFLNDLDVNFDRDEHHALRFTREGAHRKNRIIYSKDTTGHALLSALQASVRKNPLITVQENCAAIDLLTFSHSSTDIMDRYEPLTVFGAYVLDNQTGEVFAVTAKKTILATGGVGQIYRHTTNAAHSYGHGIAMAYRVGARVMNMEYVQFHPTVFAKGKSFLLSEALRGEGAILRNVKGEAFMARYHELKDLAPRDVVARAIEQERLNTSHDCVYLDISHRPAQETKDRFPAIYQKCLEEGFDLTKQPVPVVPAAHYFCGGVYATPDGRTNIRHLNAIGETACTGYHGANRLASTSLLEAVAMGYLCARADAEELASENFRIPTPKDWVLPSEKPDLNLIKQDLSTLRSTMWNYVGLMRSATHLSRAEKILRHLQNEINAFYKGAALCQELLDLRNGTQTALLITYAALRNKRSIGCHYLSN
ncbi:L-aspartate oxidase [Candidatus Avelusimicrobium caledoniensis]|uniref:L-aspartate oxidase n=1 Tax=Candidatus Avelusimicrobium caledoniensis TaxID=3416220 RepID=UPI003D14B562